MTREDHERTLRDSNAGQAPGAANPSTQAQRQTVDWAKSVMPRPTTVREALHLVRGNYEHGHPGTPPKDYKAPRERR